MNELKIIEDYRNGKSMTSIAKEFHTYATTVRRILLKHNVDLRHDRKKKGDFYAKDGDKLIAWAKSKERLVTKTELAKAFGKGKISHSYFEKYPELGQYIKNYNNAELKEANKIVADWLIKNHISYKPSDRTKLGVSVDFLLLGEYSNIAIQIMNKPHNVSQKRHKEEMELKGIRAKEAGLDIIYLKIKTDELGMMTSTKLKHVLDKIKCRRNTEKCI